VRREDAEPVRGRAQPRETHEKKPRLTYHHWSFARREDADQLREGELSQGKHTKRSLGYQIIIGAL
jgi:hypothetical protein